MDVALISCARLPEPDPDDAPLRAALAAEGITAETWAWDDPSVDWSRARLAVLRSAWNYPLHHEAFLRWADRVARVTELWNPLSVIRWNTHKRYLLELEGKGIPVTPTVLVPAGGSLSLEQICRERGWIDVVVKPAVSAASLRTIRVTPGSSRAPGWSAGERHLRGLVAGRDALVQPYLSAVDDHGERALIWIDGRLTHAVRKAPRFQDQQERVASRAVPISPGEETLARRVLETVGEPLLYARIDVAPGLDGASVLMELELVEPSLYLELCPAARDVFVTAIRRRLDGRG